LKKSIIESASSVIFPKDQKSRTQLYVFLICLALSVFIWLIIKLSQEFIHEIEYPITIVDIPVEKILVDGQDQLLTITLEEKATSLFYLRFIKEKDPIVISYGNMVFRTKVGKSTGIIHPSLLLDHINRQLELDYSIVSLAPDTLKYIFENRKSKTIPVMADFEIKPASQRLLFDSVKIIPPEVTITGPSSEVDSMHNIFLVPEKFLMLKDSLVTERKINLPEGSNHLSVEPAEVKIIIPIEEYTEASTEVNIVPVSKEYLQVKTFPESARIFFWIALSDFRDIDPSMFVLTADIDSARRMGFKKVPLDLNKTPDYIRNPRIEPERVEYIIIRQ